MSEQQSEQKYADLIEKLLACPAGEEDAVLQANIEQVEAGLVAKMRPIATELSQQGKENGLWLMQFAGQIAQKLGLETAEENLPEDLGQFLFETLQLVVHSQAAAQQVYPFLASHQEDLNERLLQWLPALAAQWLGGDLEQQQSVAGALGGFANLIQQFPLGARWLNLELSIAAYRLTLQVYLPETFPEDWATTQNNLAAAYTRRIRGDRAENLEQAISAYQLSLQVLTREAFPKDWATTQNNLASAYRLRIKGDHAENLEQAIAAYQLSLQVLTRETFPTAWAMTQNNLAIAYRNRIKGNQAQNIERAISAYKQALQVRTRKASPEKWAMTQNNLAAAYSERIEGNRAENIEQSIFAYQQALEVYTRQTFPADWATTQHNLATAYSNRIKGNRADNIEQAIAGYQQALQVRTREASPVDWSMTQNNLANAYRERIEGDRAENLEQAIAACLLALQVRTREALPEQWAMTQHSLANAYNARVRGDWAENLEQAIAAYKSALQVRTFEALPMDWAMTQNNLATAYSNRVRGDRTENIEQAIKAHQNALKVFTREAFPEKWAMTQNNLANAYRSCIRGNLAENCELAIAAYKLSLQVFTQKAFPEQWANTQSNLAHAYSNRLRGKPTENIKQATEIYHKTLKVLTPEAFPNDCRRIARSLGTLYFEQKNWIKAADAYALALQAAEYLYQSCIFIDSKAAELTETDDLPRRMAYALARINDFPEAIVTLEQSRARGLSEALARDRVHLENLADRDLYTRYKTLTNQFRTLEAQRRDFMVSSDRDRLTDKDIRKKAIALREQNTALIQSIRQIPGYATFLTLPTFQDVQEAAKQDCPLVYLISTSAGSLALIVTLEENQTIWLDCLSETQLIELLDETWFAAYAQSQRDRQARTTESRQSWFNAIDSVTRQLWEPLMQPIVQCLKANSFTQAILIPTGYLSLLPLHAAWVEDTAQLTGRRYALDDIHFTYIPNAKSLTAVRLIAERPRTDSILAIDNPLQDLPNSKYEVDIAVASFSKNTVLKHEEATIEAVQSQLSGNAIAHFSCHGTADFTAPLNSGLLMSDGLLTLKDIFALDLASSNGIRLTILSACETGLQGIENADEAISLPTGLLQAGVAGIIASLWSVADLSTTVLLARFYDLWRENNIEPAAALHQAQQWVRNTTSQQKAKYFQATNPDLYQNLILLPADHFAHPFYWAAFSYVGV